MSGDGFGPALCADRGFKARLAALSGNKFKIDEADYKLIVREFGVSKKDVDEFRILLHDVSELKPEQIRNFIGKIVYNPANYPKFIRFFGPGNWMDCFSNESIRTNLSTVRRLAKNETTADFSLWDVNFIHMSEMASLTGLEGERCFSEAGQNIFCGGTVQLSTPEGYYTFEDFNGGFTVGKFPPKRYAIYDGRRTIAVDVAGIRSKLESTFGQGKVSKDQLNLAIRFVHLHELSHTGVDLVVFMTGRASDQDRDKAVNNSLFDLQGAYKFVTNIKFDSTDEGSFFLATREVLADIDALSYLFTNARNVDPKQIVEIYKAMRKQGGEFFPALVELTAKLVDSSLSGNGKFDLKKFRENLVKFKNILANYYAKVVTDLGTKLSPFDWPARVALRAQIDRAYENGSFDRDLDPLIREILVAGQQVEMFIAQNPSDVNVVKQLIKTKTAEVKAAIQ